MAMAGVARRLVRARARSGAGGSRGDASRTLAPGGVGIEHVDRRSSKPEVAAGADRRT